MVYTYNGRLCHFRKKLSHVTTWMNLEDSRLSEVSQLQKDKHCDLYEVSKVIKFTEEIQIQTKFIEIESRMVVTRVWGKGTKGSMASSSSPSFRHLFAAI